MSVEPGSDYISFVEDIASQLALRDRFLANRWKTLTPAQRLDAIDRLQQRAWYLIQLSPGGVEQFMRRNFKARAIDVNGSANDR